VTTATLTDADVRVRDAVMRQLDWDPEMDASAVGVAAKNGTVTLTGFIDSCCGKLAAERATGTRSVDCSRWRHLMWYATCALFSPQKS
jgi:osmotically-inducible protein OsmY